ncbi:hypothetical protein [Mycobacterium palustre]|uniref:Uncharacterized protein n=1 Tax=Mycobacterium palustre TaxID=153971 RepID=A0A1X1ZKI4_9MYCO|nr:hypothetical protein [Mycobacterium palustre]MCV7102844.1 hypothetical protein [Mycobacterium palustre]ORW23631.1 hypothetical protein AWC19_11200 [Mycobacterium palustre]
MTIRHGDRRLERRGEVAKIGWAASRLNLFTPEVADAHDAVLDDLPTGARALIVRAEGKVLLRGSGRSSSPPWTPRPGTKFSRRLLGLVQRIEGLRLPTVAVMHGLKLSSTGAGCCTHFGPGTHRFSADAYARAVCCGLDSAVEKVDASLYGTGQFGEATKCLRE